MSAAKNEPLNQQLKVMLSETMSERIDADTRPGRNRSDVGRDALEFYFEFRDKILREQSAKYRAKKKR